MSIQYLRDHNSATNVNIVAADGMSRRLTRSALLFL